MEPGQNEPIDYRQPVAYDVQGRPLYLHPSADNDSSDDEPHKSEGDEENKEDQSREDRSSSTPMGEDPEDIKRKHELSVQEYPRVHLDEDEYIIIKVQRSVMGIVGPAGGAIALAVIVIAGIFIYPEIRAASTMNLPSTGSIILPALLFLALDALFVYIAVWIYYRNRLYVTNKCVIGYIQQSLFDRRIQKASLDRIEDVSSHQSGLLPTMFNYGTIRMSTIGDESNYHLNFVENPGSQADTINDAVSKHKEHSSQVGRWRNP